MTDPSPSPSPGARGSRSFWRSDAAADADDEIRFHLESQIAEFMRSGMSAADARAAAIARFGDVGGINRTLRQLGRKRERAVRLSERIDRIRQDARFAIRQFARNPAFTAVAVLTMAVAIGGNTAIFSVADSVLLKPLPYANGSRLLDLRERLDGGSMVVAAGNYDVWRHEASDFEALGAYAYQSYTLSDAGAPDLLLGYRASADYWKAMYIPPLLGRYFTADDDRPGAPHVVVLSAGLWRSTFAGDRAIVGRTITLDGEPYTVVGVASPDYAIDTHAPAFWVPMALTPVDAQNHSDHELAVVGLLRRGVSPQDGIRQLTSIETRLAHAYPHSYFDGGIVARPLQSSIVAPARSLVVMLAGAVGFVLLIACVNVANLLLARGAARRTEVAIRGALGAGRRRIVGQLLIESLLLSLAGGVVGVLVAVPLVRFIVRSAPSGVPRIQDATIDLRVLLFTLALSITCGLVFGLAPALRVSRLDLQRTLRDGSRGSATAVRDRFRAGLVVGEIALALVLLDGAGLLLRSAVELQRVDPGFGTRNLLLSTLQLPRATYPSDTAAAAVLLRIRDGVASLPGVRSATLVSRAPIAAFGANCAFFPDGSESASHARDANARVATDNFFETLGIRLVRGRMFDVGDVAGSAPVVMINVSLARELYGSADPIGRRLTACTDPATGHAHWATVVGITSDIHAAGLGADPPDEVYYPLAQAPQRAMTLIVRGAVSVSSLVAPIQRVIASVDPTLPLSQTTTMQDVIDRSMTASRFIMTLFGLLGLTGLALATVGVYGVIAYFVAQRRQEFGVRMALGADSGRVLGLVVRHGLALAILGVVLGSIGSLWAARLVRSQLHGVSAHDPTTAAVVGATLVLVTVAASLVPARRATRVDPAICLRDG